MRVSHLLESLHKDRENSADDEYTPVPKHVPDLLKTVSHKSSHHNHIFRLHRPLNDHVDESVFVAEPGTERRDIYRTMEPVWACTVDVAPQKTEEATPQGLIALDKPSQEILEQAHLSQAKLCRLDADSTTGLCTVSFDKEKVVPTSSRLLIFGKDVKRILAPVWWFQVKRNELHQFDLKNQLRLEAYEDCDSTLTLTDKAFADPFTVAIKNRGHREIEWQGFMYLNTIPRTGLGDTNDVTYSGVDDENYSDLCIQGIDDFPNFNKFNQVDEVQEQKEEEAEKKTHLNNAI